MIYSRERYSAIGNLWDVNSPHLPIDLEFERFKIRKRGA